MYIFCHHFPTELKEEKHFMCNIQHSYTHGKHVQTYKGKKFILCRKIKKIIARFVIFVMNEYECICCISMNEYEYSFPGKSDVGRGKYRENE